MSMYSGRQKQSSLWDYFIYDGVTDKSTCSVQHVIIKCGKEISSSISTNVISRLRVGHKAQFAEFEEKEKKRKAVTAR